MSELIRDYYDNGNVRYEIYYNDNNEYHREDGPAIIRYYENGNINYKRYYINGIHHRKNGAAWIEYYQNGNIKMKTYIVNGKSLKENCRSVIYYDKNGNASYKNYYINGGILIEDSCKKWKSNFLKQPIKMIQNENYINNLEVMKIFCIESNNQKLLDVINSRIIQCKLIGNE